MLSLSTQRFLYTDGRGQVCIAAHLVALLFGQAISLLLSETNRLLNSNRELSVELVI